MIKSDDLNRLQELFGHKLQENVKLSNFTTMNVGGPADALMIAQSAEELAQMVGAVWALHLPVHVLGGGSNLLVSDSGLEGVTIINHAHNIKINTKAPPYTVWAESGALMVNLGRKLILRGLKGMEWAATIPGSVGGAVYGNAGAFGKDTCCDLISADILHRDFGREIWPCERLDYTYRASKLKRDDESAVVLSALFRVEKGDSEEIRNEIDGYRKRRANIQPPGPSVGSVFRNPEGYSAGKLIEQVGLKGKMIGGAIISPKHANFIINENNASARDILDLILLAREKVYKEFEVNLIPEIELIGEWENLPEFLQHTQRKAK